METIKLTKAQIKEIQDSLLCRKWYFEKAIDRLLKGNRNLKEIQHTSDYLIKEYKKAKKTTVEAFNKIKKQTNIS